MVRSAVCAACAVAVMAFAACAATADGPPEIAVDRTPCAHCGMLISEPVFASAYRAEGSEARAFDDIACMLSEVRREPQPTTIRFWFHDAENGEWIDGSTAVFVKSSALQTPMAGGTLAYRNAERAARGAATQRGAVMNLGALLASPVKESER